MSLPLPIEDYQVEAYQGLVSQLARRYDGLYCAEYDDLYQEGMWHVIAALRVDAFPSKNLIAKRMTHWVGLCARRGLTDDRLDELYSDDDMSNVFDQ